MSSIKHIKCQHKDCDITIAAKSHENVRYCRKHSEVKEKPSTAERWLTVICCLLISGFLFGVGFVIAFRLLLL